PAVAGRQLVGSARLQVGDEAAVASAGEGDGDRALVPGYAGQPRGVQLRLGVEQTVDVPAERVVTEAGEQPGARARAGRRNGPVRHAAGRDGQAGGEHLGTELGDRN